MWSLARNLRFGARMLVRNPGFTLATVLTLALGIGANTAIFTVTNALLLRPFPFRDPQQLITIATMEKDRDRGGTLVRYEMVRDQGHSFQAVAVWANDNLNLTGDGKPEQAAIARVSPSFFSVFDVNPELGRVFTDDEGRTDGKLVAMLSNKLWRNRYRADLAIVGKTIMLDSTAYTVIGVLPANAQFPFVGRADVWTPRYFEHSLMTPQRLRQGAGYLTMAARLKPEVTLVQANAELAVLNQRYREQNPNAPDVGPDVVMTAGDLRNLVVGDMRGKLWVLSGAVALVLLIACANVASLMLSRALTRRREIAVRTALGADRSTILLQVLTESMMLALLAGMVGTGLSWAAVHALSVWGAAQLPPGVPIGIDTRVLAFTLLSSIFAGVAFGVAPAFQLARVEPNVILRDEGRGASAGRSRAHTQSALVVGQVTLSLLLLVGAGLLLRSFVRLLAVDSGFDARNVLTMDLSLSTAKYTKPDQQAAFFDEVLRRVSAMPAVRSAAVSAALPLSFKRITPMLPEGQPEAPLAERPFIGIEAISPHWFETMGVPVRGGRMFTSGDDAHAPKVAIVNEVFARQFWHGENAIGKHIVIGRGPGASEVVGVAADVKNQGLAQEPQPQVYVPFAQLPWADMNLLVRTAVPPLTAAGEIEAQIAAIDQDQPVTGVQTIEALIDTSRAQPRFTLMLVAAFAATALVLAIVGIYGVLSFSVAQRQQEFGIRLALGATRADILRLVLRQGVVLTAAGVGAGLAAAYLLTGLAAGLLYKTGARDLATFVVVPAIFLSIALLASYFAARRATRVNPIEAMR